MKRNRDKYGRGSAATNGAGFFDLEPGDTFAVLEGKLRARISETFVNRALITLKDTKQGGNFYAVEAVDIMKDANPERTPRGAMSEDLNAAPLQNLASFTVDRIAYYVGDVNRTKPTFLNRSEPFSQERAAELLANLLAVKSNGSGAASTADNLRRHPRQISIRTAIGWMVAMAFLWKRWCAIRKMRAGWRLPVVFHALPAEEFGRILDWFAAHGVVKQMDLSMDDGWLCVKDYLPHLKKHGVRAKLYVAPGETVRGNVWTDVAVRMGIPCEEWRSWYGLNEAERYERLGEERKKLEGGVGERRLLSREEVIEIAKTGLVDIENHTWSHLSATSRPVDEVMDEVRRAQAELTAWTGRAPKYLAWPFGRGNAELDERARQMGLKTVYTKNLPEGRSMAIENVTFQENIGRLLGAWPKVGETL